MTAEATPKVERIVDGLRERLAALRGCDRDRMLTITVKVKRGVPFKVVWNEQEEQELG